MENIINISNLKKTFNNTTIINNVSFQVKQGEIIGLLGSNGAGKTTFLKLISGLLKVDNGEITILRKNPWYERDKILTNIGIMIEQPVFYEHLTAFENIQIHLEYMNIKNDIKNILNLVGLEIDNKPISKFSLGMKQKLAIARAISHNPKILLLDEPINGLDPISILEFRKLLKFLKEKNTTIILSSHILNELFETVENIVVLSNGNLENLGKLSVLKQKYENKLENYLIEKMRGIKND